MGQVYHSRQTPRMDSSLTAVSAATVAANMKRAEMKEAAEKRILLVLLGWYKDGECKMSGLHSKLYRSTVLIRVDVSSYRLHTS